MARGLNGVQLVISDAHEGLRAALALVKTVFAQPTQQAASQATS